MVSTALVLTLTLYILSVQGISGEDCASKKVSIVADILEDTVNGTFEINMKDLHWHVSILQPAEGGRMRFLCGGSLVQRGLVVTSAACVARVNVTRLRAAVGLAFMHTPTNGQNLTVYNVSEKFYPYRDNYTVEKEDLAILRLSNVSGVAEGNSPRLTVLPAATRLSKHCFAIGWGHDQTADGMVETCSKPSYKNALLASLYNSKYSHMSLKNLLDIQNILRITEYVASRVFNMLSIFKNSRKDELPRLLEEPTCLPEEYSPLKVFKMSASGKLRNSPACPDTTTTICLHARNSADDLAQKVDIGSPIFCKIKKPKVDRNCPQQNSSTSQYVLAGVLTSKKFKAFPLMKHNTNVSVLKATNVTQYSDFILYVLNRKR